MTDLEMAKKLLDDGQYTCVLFRDGQVKADRRRGVQPLLALLESGDDYRGFSAADKVVGKAAAFLYVLLGIRELYAGILSEHAAGVLTEYGVEFQYGTLVTAVRNRTNTGFCPMETAVLDVKVPEKAPEAIRKKLQELQK